MVLSNFWHNIVYYECWIACIQYKHSFVSEEAVLPMCIMQMQMQRNRKSSNI